MKLLSVVLLLSMVVGAAANADCSAAKRSNAGARAPGETSHVIDIVLGGSGTPSSTPAPGAGR